jgi:photosystem II protein
MSVSIEFIENLSEKSLPIVKLTKSRNGKTGTATFLFIKPSVFSEFNSQNFCINGMYLLWDNKKIFTKDIEIIFKNGKPFALKTILIFKNANEWFNFLNFMNLYSKEKGLFFAE